MRQKDDSFDLDPKNDQFIFALLTSRTKEEAARKAGISRATMYRRLADRRFVAAFRASRRQIFDDALFVLERNAQAAAQAMVDEFGPDRTGDRVLLNAATRVLDIAFKAQGNIAVEEELAELRTVMAELEAGQAPPVIVEKVVVVNRGITAQEQAEACRLRMEWMGELGHPLEDIATSLRYNRPQSVEEERETLDLVEQQLEQERTCTSLLETGGVLGD